MVDWDQVKGEIIAIIQSSLKRLIENMYPGKYSWKAQGYRMMLIWLHGVEDNPLKELYEGLVNIDCKKLAGEL